MRNKLIILIIILSVVTAKAQKFNVQPGILGGVSYYMGEINHSKLFYSPKPTFGFIFKHDINKHYGLRFDVLQVSLSGSDLDFTNGYQQTRALSFNNKIYEFALKTEFNFLEFPTGRRESFTTFITGGVALFLDPEAASFFNMSIPAGLGIKYSTGKRLTIGAEWVYRKTFTDKLDMIPDNNYSPTNNFTEIKQITSDNNKDWYAIGAIFITYNFRSSKKWCPAYMKK